MTAEAIGHEMTMSKCQQIATLVSSRTNAKGNGTHGTAIAPLEFMRQSATFVTMRDVSEPTLGIVLQGKKEVLLGEETYRYGVAQYLVISVDLPFYGYVTEATPEQPYLGLKLDLDAVQLCDIMSQTPPSVAKKESVRGWFISNAAPSLMDCFLKLVKLLDTPQDIPFLAPLIIREIYYRLLVGEQSEAVRQIAISGSNMQNIAKAIKLIKTNFAKPIRIEDLAEQVNMSSSSLHRHFKAVTSSSPLQYQKQLRLLKARHLMLAENADAASTAYQVGYESPSQFSREYSRMFGASPIKDIARLRLV
jgi:AraC-like DNA-binding protein